MTNTTDYQDIVAVLKEALSLAEDLSGETFVIKCEGKALRNFENMLSFAKDVVMLKNIGVNPIIVHGGIAIVDEFLDRFNIQSSFVDGERVVDPLTIEMMEMVLSGLVNKQLVTAINMAGGMAIGISGKDASLIEAKKLRRTKSRPDSNVRQIVDLGFIGEPITVNPEILINLEDSDLIPVISPVGIGESGATYHLNPDHVAAIIASSLAASKLIILSEEKVEFDFIKMGKNSLTSTEARKIIRDNTNISRDILGNIRNCIHAVEHHTEAAHIISNMVEHALLIEVLTNHKLGLKIVLG